MARLDRSTLSSVVLLVVVASALSQDSTDPGVRGEHPRGEVFLYGERLQKPYVFGEIDADTLLVNGLPLLPPRPRPDYRPPGSGLSEERKAELHAQATIMDDVLNRASASTNEAKTDADAVARFLAVLEASPYVARVDRSEDRLRVHFTFDLSAVVFLSNIKAGTSDAPVKANSEHILREELIARIREVEERGGLLCYGSDYKLYYPPRTAERVLSLVARVAHGDTVTDEDLTGISARSATLGFLADVRAANAESVDSEE